MKNCTGINCIMQYGTVDPETCRTVSYCPYATPPVTNYDRIISKTPEELAEALCLIAGGLGPVSSSDGRDWFDWLKEESKGG